MRKVRTSQVSIFDDFAQHDIGRELEGMSGWLDEHPEVLEWVEADLKRQRGAALLVLLTMVVLASSASAAAV